MGLESFLKELVPFVAMVLMECGEVAMTTISKAAMNNGMSNFVFIVYYNTLGLLIFLPYFLFQIRRKKPPPITLALLWRFMLLGFFGKSLVLFGYIGIGYSSPSLASALGNLTPVFTFLLAIMFRMEKLDMKSSSCQAKSLGTIVAVAGAFVITFYTGPRLLSESSPSSSPYHLLFSQHSSWILGGLFLAISYFFGSVWNILQAKTVMEYPDQTTVVFFYVLFGTMQCTVISLIVERNPSTWSLHLDTELVAIVYSAIFATVIRNCVITWCLNRKGPLYVSMFKPLGMIVAMVGGILFLGDILYLGSIIGSIIIAIGFYTVIWGQAKEEDTQNVQKLEPSSEHAPLLQSYKTPEA